MLKKYKSERGITLIALIITIIILIILAGISINSLLGDNGIFKVAEQAARNYKDAENKELGLLEDFNTELNEITDFDNLKQYNETLGVNKPKLLTGMTPIKFEQENENAEFTVATTNEADVNWYNYTNKQWANAQTEDGSMWVWIPRYAYRINYTDATDKSKGGTVEVVFLIGSTDNYYDVEDGNKIKTAKRAKSANEIVDTTTGYTVHPAFTDESEINYVNGGWDKELTGIWVAKFEAGYATDKNVVASKINVPSTVNYTQTQVNAPAIETGTENGGWIAARNHVDGEYGTLTTAIKYPTFQGSSYSMNYISVSDAFDISRALTGKNNIYGLKSNNADSHLMKNSEWGAVAYFSKSDYGLNRSNIYINNINMKNQVTSVYAITGCSAKNKSINGDNPDEKEVVLENVTEADLETKEALETKIQTVAYTWNQAEGQQASTTGTVYGVYDMSGGAWEITAGYVANGNGNLKYFGASVAYNGNTLKTVSTKYTMVYPHDASKDNTSIEINDANLLVANEANYALNTKIYGDAIREVSMSGTGATSWMNDRSKFWGLQYPFSINGGHFGRSAEGGVTAFTRTGGDPIYHYGFRAVLVAK